MWIANMTTKEAKPPLETQKVDEPMLQLKMLTGCERFHAHSYCTLLDCKEECVGVIFSHHHPLCSCHRLSRCLNKQCSIIVNGLSSSKFLAPESLQPMSYFFLCSVLLQSVFDFFFFHLKLFFMSDWPCGEARVGQDGWRRPQFSPVHCLQRQRHFGSSRCEWSPWQPLATHSVPIWHSKLLCPHVSLLVKYCK